MRAVSGLVQAPTLFGRFSGHGFISESAPAEMDKVMMHANAIVENAMDCCVNEDRSTRRLGITQLNGLFGLAVDLIADGSLQCRSALVPDFAVPLCISIAPDTGLD